MSKRSLRREYEAKLKAERERHAQTQAVLRDLATERGGVVAALVENRAKILMALHGAPRLLWELLLPSERAEQLERDWSEAIFEASCIVSFGVVPTSYAISDIIDGDPRDDVRERTEWDDDAP